MTETDRTFNNGYALIIGIGADMPVTIQDATALHNLLTNPDRAAYPSTQTTLLTETNATRNKILTALDHLNHQTSQNPNATAIIYYSGHGAHTPNTNNYFLIPNDYFTDQQTITSQEFTKKIEAIQAKKLIVILDCCHAAGIPNSKDPTQNLIKSPIPKDILDTLATGSGKVIIASCRAEEPSLTATPYSAFTNCLLESLQGQGTKTPDGYARILDILAYLFAQVPQRTNNQQHPYINKILDLDDNFPLCYYAGGSKNIPINPSTTTTTNLSAGARLRLASRQATLTAEHKLRSAKIEKIRTALLVETNPTIQFQLEQQVLTDEAELKKVEKELESIEQQLGQRDADTLKG
jgi:Caspase domain